MGHVLTQVPRHEWILFSFTLHTRSWFHAHYPPICQVFHHSLLVTRQQPSTRLNTVHTEHSLPTHFACDIQHNVHQPRWFMGTNGSQLSNHSSEHKQRFSQNGYHSFIYGPCFVSSHHPVLVKSVCCVTCCSACLKMSSICHSGHNSANVTFPHHAAHRDYVTLIGNALYP